MGSEASGRRELVEEIGDIDETLHVIMPARETRALLETIAAKNHCPHIHSAMIRLQRACGTRFSGSFGRRLVVTDEMKTLSSDELDVFNRVIAGQQRNEIARERRCSKQAVYARLHRIWKKLGTPHTDAALIHYAYQNGLVKL